MKNTSLPRVPVCQPITASFTPTPDPAYHPMNEESASTRPATQVMAPAGGPETARSPPWIVGRPGGAGPARTSRQLELEEFRGFHPAKYGDHSGRKLPEPAGLKGVNMLDKAEAPDAKGVDYVEFLAAGTAVTGAYQCAGCGYGVTLRSSLPVCPMCSGTTWERADWSPFGRARANLR